MVKINEKIILNYCKIILFLLILLKFLKYINFQDQKKEYVYSLSFINNDTQLVTGFIDGSLILINTSDMKITKQITLERKYDKPAENQDPGNTVKFINFFLN
jgi:WD40 repeat protein